MEVALGIVGGLFIVAVICGFTSRWNHQDTKDTLNITARHRDELITKNDRLRRELDKYHQSFKEHTTEIRELKIALNAIKENIEEFLPHDSDDEVFWQEVAMTDEFAPLTKCLNLIEML
jgi:hypothetical protein